MKPFVLLIVAFGIPGLCSAQDGLSIPSWHPRIWWNASRINTAKTWFASHPFSPSSMDGWAFHYIVSGNASDCTANAIPMALASTISLHELESVASDSLRWNGEVVALVYDWCNDQLSPSQAQLLRDRWAGATTSYTDPPHTPADLASTAGSKVVTSASGPFLPNMAGNNTLWINSGTNFVPGVYGVVAYNSADSVTLDRDPTDGNNASGGSARISGYVDSARQQTWGGATMPGSNYFWGYWRDELEWGIALSQESQYSSVFLDDALGTSGRWTSDALPFWAGTGRYALSVPSTSASGGVFSEGSQYGNYMWWYQHLTNNTANLMGRNLWSETTWLLQAIYRTIYNTTLSPVLNTNTSTSYYQVFPQNEDEMTSAGFTCADVTACGQAQNYIGDMMLETAEAYAGTNAGAYARQWLNTVGYSTVTNYHRSVDPGGSGLAFSSLPLDYYASGQGEFYSKNGWTSGSTAIKVLSAVNVAGSHLHYDSGDFGIYRNGRWLTKESTGYNESITCSYGQSCDVMNDQAHNVLLLGPSSSTTCNIGAGKNYLGGYGTVTRLESQPNYSYAVVDLTSAFHAVAGQDQPCRDDNPYASTVQREFLFIKPLETLVVFDRILATYNPQSGDTHPNITPSAVVKTVLIHSVAGISPSAGTNTFTLTDNGQVLKCYTLLPTSPTYTVVDEGTAAAPNHTYRMEITDSGTAQSYELNVLQARDGTAGQDFSTASVNDNGSSYTLTLQHPALGNATIVFQKGATSTGGSFGYSSSGTPSLAPLATSFNGPTVTVDGLTWPSVTGSTGSSCDLNNDGVVNSLDVQIAVNQALGTISCSNADLSGNGTCSVIDVQRVIDAANGQACRVGP